MNKPLTYKKLHEMELDIKVTQIQKLFEMIGLIKKERIGRNTFTEKYFKLFKIKGTETQKTTD